MISYVIDIDLAKCDGCGDCVDICPLEIYVMENEKPEARYQEECIACKSCLEACEKGAIRLEEHETD